MRFFIEILIINIFRSISYKINGYLMWIRENTIHMSINHTLKCSTADNARRICNIK